jgi:hypothetical protein
VGKPEHGLLSICVGAGIGLPGTWNSLYITEGICSTNNNDHKSKYTVVAGGCTDNIIYTPVEELSTLLQPDKNILEWELSPPPPRVWSPATQIKRMY